jgi:2-C-methyl-D-erythritol 4-phosphate cytidylyltransferase
VASTTTSIGNSVHNLASSAATRAGTERAVRPPGYRHRVSTDPVAAAVVLAGGSGTRLGADGNKVYLPLAGRRLVSWALQAFADVSSVRRLVLVVRAADRALAEETVGREVRARVEIVEGGPSRHHSEQHALAHLGPAIRAGEIDVVAIHDGARPLAGRRLIADTIDAASTYGAAVPGVPLDDAAVPHPDGGVLPEPADRRLVRVQTPQAFRALPLLDAYECAARDDFVGTDTAACMERYGGLPVHCLLGDPRNIKVTYPQDLFLAERLLALADYRVS